MNKKLMILMVATIGVGMQIQTHRGGGDWGGGFAVGTLTGVAAASIANSGNRYVSPEESERRASNDSRRSLDRQIKRLEKAKQKLSREIDQLEKRKDLSDDERNLQITDKKKQIDTKERQHQDLLDRLADIF